MWWTGLLLGFLDCNNEESCNSNKVLAAKEPSAASRNQEN